MKTGAAAKASRGAGGCGYGTIAGGYLGVRWSRRPGADDGRHAAGSRGRGCEGAGRSSSAGGISYALDTALLRRILMLKMHISW